MNRSPIQISETVDAARAVMAQLEQRASGSRHFLDIGDLSAIQTTIRRIEEYLSFAAELEDVLRQQLVRTNERIASSPA